MLSILKTFLSYFGVGIHPRQRKRIFSGTGLHHISIGKFTLLVDKNHSLPYNIKHHPEYNKNIGRIAAFLCEKKPGSIIFDIGANVGDTVFFIKNETDAEIVCIEGDEYYYKLLEKNISQLKNVSAYHYLLGEQEKISTFFLRKEQGTATIDASEKDGKSVSMISLDKFIIGNVLSPDKIGLIKIDTDGYDMKILRGATETLKKYKPILFFEYDTEFMKKSGEKGLDTLAILSEIGYDSVLFYDNYGRFILSSNLSNTLIIEQMHNYISGYAAPFPFFDVCIFHQGSAQMAREFILSETQYLQKSK